MLKKAGGKMIITIGRQCGCSGDEVGRKLSKLLNIPFYTKKDLIGLAPNEEKTITFVCSLEENIEEIDGKEIIKKHN